GVDSLTCDGLPGGPVTVLDQIAATISQEGVTRVRCTARDKAGNVSAEFVLPAIQIDKTPPVINVLRAAQANEYGWNNTDVTVHFAASDTLSGISGPATRDFAFHSDGQYPVPTQTFSDLAGNSASASTADVLLDKTPPTFLTLTQNPP